jgi:hypothetical protein
VELNILSYTYMNMILNHWGNVFICMDIKLRVGTLHIQKSRSEDIHEILEKKVAYIYIYIYILTRHEGIYMKFSRRMFDISIHSFVKWILASPTSTPWWATWGKTRHESSHSLKGTHHGWPCWCTAKGESFCCSFWRWSLW